jgi:UDP-N-acetylglucosamine diphosphorylase / glucose-1-phosphate thymidylyltransferase / UDP-N-acetylgalactosamine diphosphorylase / glucosamine-1-phosphate N-acetyltransferase / galactosamine-1-phosphate N-acetyltransferase
VESPFSPEALFDLSRFEHRGLFIGSGEAWTALRDLERWIREHLRPGNRGLVEVGAFVDELVEVREGARIEAGAYVRGPTIIGEGTKVRHVGDSILGGRVNLGAGAKLANLKVVGESVVVRDREGRPLPTGLRKLGAMLGDDVEIGCNVVAAPGTVIGPRTVVYPLASIRGTIPGDSIVAWKPALEVHPRRG